MDAYKEYNSLIATVSQINAEKAEQKKIGGPYFLLQFSLSPLLGATEKIADKSARDKKKAELEEAFVAKKEELLPGLAEDIAKGRLYVASLVNPRLKDILIYYYKLPPATVNKMNKTQLSKAIDDHFLAPQEDEQTTQEDEQAPQEE
jgi:hypothetical protein